jgi:hypothetical protein
MRAASARSLALHHAGVGDHRGVAEMKTKISVASLKP